jgi:acyl carrier protein
MDQILVDLQELFRRVFGNDDLIIDATMTSSDIDGWDSMAHINLIIAIEKKFGIKFAGNELSAMRGPGETVGSLAKMVALKTGQDLS